MALFVALRLFFVRDGFSLAWFFHPCCGDEEMYSRLLAAAQSSLTCLEELLWKSGPIISFLFPAYGPLVSALIFACSNLTPQILSFARPVLSDSFGQAGGFEPDTAETTIEQGVADAVAFGCHFVANPDLPQRIRDMPALVAHFVEFLDWRVGRRIDHIPEETMWDLCSQDWPGNIRELQNSIERASILSEDSVRPNPLLTVGAPHITVVPTPTTLADSARSLILRTLDAAGWAIGGRDGAAARLGFKGTTLIYKMRRHGISRPSFDCNLEMAGRPLQAVFVPQLQ
jgi:hypothetical protein